MEGGRTKKRDDYFLRFNSRFISAFNLLNFKYIKTGSSV